jgi:hypothetical protein
MYSAAVPTIIGIQNWSVIPKTSNLSARNSIGVPSLAADLLRSRDQEV